MTDAHGDGAPRRAVTLGDVARRAGVSQPTASRVLNGSARQVNEVYRQRVLAAARELGYTPNLSAQAVARGTSRTIALVISAISDAYFSEMAASILRQAQNVKTLTDIVPQLTTVHVPLDEVAADAIYRATVPQAELRRRTIPTHPIIRESTPPLTGALGLQSAGDQVDAPEPLER